MLFVSSSSLATFSPGTPISPGMGGVGGGLQEGDGRRESHKEEEVCVLEGREGMTSKLTALD